MTASLRMVPIIHTTGGCSRFFSSLGPSRSVLCVTDLCIMLQQVNVSRAGQLGCRRRTINQITTDRISKSRFSFTLVLGLILQNRDNAQLHRFDVHLDHREIQTSSDPLGWPARVPDDVSYRELAKRDPLIECLICGILRGNSSSNMKAYVNQALDRLIVRKTEVRARYRHADVYPVLYNIFHIFALFLCIFVYYWQVYHFLLCIIYLFIYLYIVHDHTVNIQKQFFEFCTIFISSMIIP